MMKSGYIKVAYEGKELDVNYDPATTIERILMYSLIEHGLPTVAYKDFALFAADGRELKGIAVAVAEFAGVNPDDSLTLRYLRADIQHD